MSEPTTCPKCGGAMVRGFLFHSIIITPWFEGEPERGMFGGTKPPVGPGLPVAAFRCGKCGYLDLYAGPEYSPK